MLALRHAVDRSPLHLSIGEPSRGSIGSKRNPASTRAILDAAATLLTRDGLAGFSIDAIARIARCGKPTIYRWWPDKLALLIDLHARDVAALPTATDIAAWIPAIRGFWQSTLAGMVLRAIVAEAQTASDGPARLRNVLASYEASALAATNGDAPLARSAVAQACFAWLTGGEPTHVTIPASAEPETEPEASSVRHRGEWVD